MDEAVPPFLLTLFKQLRRRHFPVGIDDFAALQIALQAGFGWSSREDLCDLCCTLWAKSKREQAILKALFDQSEVPTWQLSETDRAQSDLDNAIGSDNDEPSEQTVTPSVPLIENRGNLPPISFDGIDLPKYHFVLVPQFPLTYREVAQAWRRLRQPIRKGPPIELDVEATIKRRSRVGIASDIILVPRRRNTARLLLLVDRQGSMTPFHAFVDEVCTAIREAGNLESVALFYFHDAPVEYADETILEALPKQLFPILDSILAKISSPEGFLYEDPDLLSPQPLNKVLQTFGVEAAVAVISDAGAARGRYDPLRLLDTLAFFKTLRKYTHRYIWLNPLPEDYWRNNTAAKLARHVPMLSLDQAGMYQAVNVLRGQPYFVERPL